METTRSKVYPTNMMSSLSNDAMTTSVDGGVWRDLTSVDPMLVTYIMYIMYNSTK